MLYNRAIKSQKSFVFIQKCIFRDNFSKNSGGVIYVNDYKSLNVLDIEAYNSTAIDHV